VNLSVPALKNWLAPIAVALAILLAALVPLVFQRLESLFTKLARRKAAAVPAMSSPSARGRNDGGDSQPD